MMTCWKQSRRRPTGAAKLQTIVAASCLAAVGLLLPLPSLGADAEAGVVPSTSVVATVNGTPIDDAELQIMMTSMMKNSRPSRRADIDDAQLLAREQLIVNQTMAQAAVALGLDKEPKISGALAYQRALTLSRAYMLEMLRRDPLTDARLEQEYALGLVRGRAQEYHVAHMVVAQKNRADELLAALARGEEFEALARLHSLDPAATKNSGDLGWMRIDQNEEFRFVDAVKSLKPGAYTLTPIKGPTGWHVIKLLEAPRAANTTPPFADLSAEVKTRLRTRAMARQVDQIEKQLLAKAVVTRPKLPNFAVALPSDAAPAGSARVVPASVQKKPARAPAR